MREWYKQNGYRFLIPNDYDEIIAYLNKHMWGVRIRADTALTSSFQRNHVRHILKVSISNKYDFIYKFRCEDIYLHLSWFYDTLDKCLIISI